VSREDQTTENQRLELERIAEAREWEIVATYSDHAISGAKFGKDRPELERLIDMVSEQQRTIEKKISDLKRLNSELGRLSQQCNGVGPCRIIEALYP